MLRLPNHYRHVGFALPLVLLPLVPVAAQQVRGRVVDVATEAGLAGVRLVLTSADSAGTGRQLVADGISDSTGAFLLRLPAPGAVTLSALRVGFSPLGPTESFDVGPGESVELVVRLSALSQRLDTVRVHARRPWEDPALKPRLRDFAWRRELGTATRCGFFFDSTEIAQAPSVISLLVGLPGVTATRTGVRGELRFSGFAATRQTGGCVPWVYVDGARLSREMRVEDVEAVIPAGQMAGIEIYPDATKVPPEYQFRGDCGVVLVWTK
jgi:hypothetical protein